MQAEEAPSRILIVKLLSDAEQVRENEITVGPIHTVDRKLAKGTTTMGGVCVTFILSRIIDSKRRRVVDYRTLYHDADWGWCLYAKRDIPGGEAIDVVSETKGSVQLK